MTVGLNWDSLDLRMTRLLFTFCLGQIQQSTHLTNKRLFSTTKKQPTTKNPIILAKRSL